MFKYRRLVKLDKTNNISSALVNETLFNEVKKVYNNAFVKENIIGFSIPSFLHFGINKGAEGRILIQDMDTYMYVVFQMKNSQQPGILILLFIFGVFAVILNNISDGIEKSYQILLFLSIAFIIILFTLWLGFKASSVSRMGYLENKLFDDLNLKE